LGALGGKLGRQYHQFRFVDLFINNIITQVLVDLGVTHKFLTIELVKELGLRVSLCGAMVKKVKSKENSITGVSSLVHIQIDKWEGWGNSTLMPMDRFEVNLGKEFLRMMLSVIIPWMDKMVLLGECKAWVVFTTARNSNGNVQLVSTLSMNTVSWNGLHIYATIV